MRQLPRYLVALDIARVTGYAHGPFSAVRPAVGRWPLPIKDPYKLSDVGARVAALENMLITAFDEWEPSHLVVAQPIPSRNLGEAISSFGLLGQVLAECWRRGVKPLVMPEGTVRREMLGRGSGPTDVMKGLVMAWCNRNEIPVEDHNEGDAAVLWRWARDELARQSLNSRGIAEARTCDQVTASS